MHIYDIHSPTLQIKNLAAGYFIAPDPEDIIITAETDPRSSNPLDLCRVLDIACSLPPNSWYTTVGRNWNLQENFPSRQFPKKDYYFAIIPQQYVESFRKQKAQIADILGIRESDIEEVIAQTEYERFRERELDVGTFKGNQLQPYPEGTIEIRIDGKKLNKHKTCDLLPKLIALPKTHSSYAYYTLDELCGMMDRLCNVTEGTWQVRDNTLQVVVAATSDDLISIAIALNQMQNIDVTSIPPNLRKAVKPEKWKYLPEVRTLQALSVATRYPSEITAPQEATFTINFMHLPSILCNMLSIDPHCITNSLTIHLDLAMQLPLGSWQLDTEASTSQTLALYFEPPLYPKLTSEVKNHADAVVRILQGEFPNITFKESDKHSVIRRRYELTIPTNNVDALLAMLSTHPTTKQREEAQPSETIDIATFWKAVEQLLICEREARIQSARIRFDRAMHTQQVQDHPITRPKSVSDFRGHPNSNPKERAAKTPELEPIEGSPLSSAASSPKRPTPLTKVENRWANILDRLQSMETEQGNTELTRSISAPTPVTKRL